MKAYNKRVPHISCGINLKGFIKNYKADGPLESKISGFYVLIPSTAPIAKTLVSLILY